MDQVTMHVWVAIGLQTLLLLAGFAGLYFGLSTRLSVIETRLAIDEKLEEKRERAAKDRRRVEMEDQCKKCPALKEAIAWTETSKVKPTE
jgi:hypothetical protein